MNLLEHIIILIAALTVLIVVGVLASPFVIVELMVILIIWFEYRKIKSMRSKKKQEVPICVN